MSEKHDKWLKEYQNFLNPKTTTTSVPSELKLNTFSKIKSLIKPSAWMVFLKLLGLHTTVGFFSLSVCHQFGLNPFNTSRSLADWFMSVGGHHLCMLGCGIVFVSLSILIAGTFFTIEEVRALKRNDLLQNASLALISLGAFAAFGAELGIMIAGLWLLGGLIGGFLSTTFIFKFKRI